MAPRRACKVDGNHNEIVDGLRAYGLSVQSLASIGSGCPDIMVGGCRRTILMEIKVGGLRLNPDQATWHREWQGKVYVVNSLEMAWRACVKEGILSLKMANHG